MPRPRRPTPAGYCCHILNRGNARQRVFHKDADNAAFLKLFDEAQERSPVWLFTYCSMPNYFHVVLWPRGEAPETRIHVTLSRQAACIIR